MISAYHTSTHIKCPNAKLSTMRRVFFNALPNKREESSKQLGTAVPFCTISLWQSSKITGTPIDLVNECTASTHSCKIRSNWGVTTLHFFDSKNYTPQGGHLHHTPSATILHPFNSKKVTPHRGVVNTITGTTTLGAPAAS